MATPEMNIAGGQETALLTNILKEAVFTQQEKSIAPKVFTVHNMSGTPGLTAQIPVYPSITAITRTDVQDMTENTIATTNVTIQASEIGARLDVSDLLSESTSRNMGSDVGQLIGSAIAEKVDTEAFDLFDEANITTNNVGDSAGTDMGNYILQAVYKLRAVNAPTDSSGDYMAVIHPGQAYQLTKLLTSAGFGTSANAISNVGNSAMSTSAYIGRLYNVKIFSSAAIQDDSVATDGLGCVFSPLAFGHVIKRPLRVESQRNASLRSTEYVGSTAVKTAVVKENYACLVRSSKSLA